MTRRGGRSRRSHYPLNAHTLNHLSKAFLSGVFYLLLSYQAHHFLGTPSTNLPVSFHWRWFYQIIALITFNASLILSDREVLFKLGSPPWLAMLCNVQMQRWFGLVFSQCWLMTTLDMLALYRNQVSGLVSPSPNYIPFFTFAISLATTVSCFVSATV